MPRIVDYVDRFDGIRQAVFVLALRSGADAITLPAVADELRMSVSSVRRVLSSATHLPELGMQWIDRRQRSPLSRNAPGELPRDDPRAATWNPLLRELPCNEQRAEDARVWRILTQGYPSTAWATAATRQRELLLATLAAQVLPPELPTSDQESEFKSLLALVVGATECVCTGVIQYDEAVPLVRRHLEQRTSAWHENRPSGAA